MNNGFFRVARALMVMEIMRDPDALFVIIWLLYLVRFRATVIDGVTVGVNQVLIAKAELARRLNFTRGKLRRILDDFERLGGISCENIRNKYTLITILDPFLGGSAENTEERDNQLIERTESGSSYEKNASCEKGNPADKNLTDEENDIYVFNSDDCEKNYTASSAACGIINVQKGKPSGRDRGELMSFGKFGNVFLSIAEYNELTEYCPTAKNLIERYSAQLALDPGKNAADHFALLYRNCTYEAANNEHGVPEQKKEVNAYSFVNSCIQRHKELDEIQRNLEKAPVPKLKKRVR